MELQFFFRKSKGNNKAAAGLGKITFIIFQKNVPSIERTTGIKCKRDEWNDVEKCFTGNGAIAKNNRLEKIKLNFETILNHNNATQEDLQAFFDSLTTPDVRIKTFLEVFSEYLTFQCTKIRCEDAPRTELTIEQSTYNTYLKRKINIEKFLALRNKTRINVAHVDAKLCEDFDIWCVGTVGGQAYSNKHLKLIKSVVEHSRKCKYITHNGTDEYKLKKDPDSIAFAAVNALRNNDFGNNDTVNTVSNETITKLSSFTEFSKTEQKYVDAFLFMREMWLHIGDYKELKDEHFKIDEHGNYWLVKPRCKRLTDSGGQIQIMPLSPVAIEILNKYDTNYNGAFSKLPRSERACFMQYLKMACQKAGVTEHITLKFARSNGISNVYNNHKLRGEMIAIGAGWTSTEPLKHYLKHDFNKLRNEMLNIQVA